LDKRRSEVNNPKRQHKVASVEMAVAAVTGDSNVRDMPTAGFDPLPTALDLPHKEHRKMCSRCARPAVDRCPECGCPLCDDCVAGDEG
jgi:hypothetical protein